jgi:hypothetical protein
MAIKIEMRTGRERVELDRVARLLASIVLDQETGTHEEHAQGGDCAKPGSRSRKSNAASSRAY